MMTDFWTRLTRRWWIIPATVVLALGVALVVGLGQSTTYTSKSALTTYSQNRAPEQDAVLIQSYVDFFNNGANQTTLREAAKVPESVKFTAMPVATGPIMFIAASGSDQQQVRTAATAMAIAFRDSINAGVQQTRDSAVAALRAPFLERLARNDFILQQERVELSRSIDALNADSSGRLQNLTNANTVTKSTPDIWTTLAIGLVVGLLLGGALAWLIGGVAPRLRRPDQLAEVLGVKAFDVTSREPEGHRLQMRHVVNALAFDDLPSPVIIALTGVADTPATAVAAEELARIRASQGADVVVMRTTRDGAGSALGVVDMLRSPETVSLDDALRSTERTGGIGAGISLLAPGHPGIDPYDVMTRVNVSDLLRQLSRRFSVIVIECPPVTEAAEVQLLCSLAHRTLMVVEADTVGASAARRASRLLAQSEVHPYAALLMAERVKAPLMISFGRTAASRP
ncbi:hypothetical protein [Williamsia sp. CHRR-6]|uniref:hypothetical protein n=1 Tax=Williamsia sp. CHRR-6 TaxID=2835871 RepID=UPI001BDA6205|nr:hypothetical protein [Williamsia sp. CHRR-6]MBT0566286.1 hypothetical protein [Williamsia sp. CHRR-6]